MRSRRSLLILAFLFFLPLAAPVHADAEHFVRPAELEPDIAFWRRIYTEVSTEGGLLHDPEDLAIVYEAIEASFGSVAEAALASHRRREEALRAHPRSLASGAEDLSEEELRVRDLWPKGTRRSRFEQAAEEVRFQLGQSDRFREGIVRSGAYREQIAEIFETAGLAA